MKKIKYFIVAIIMILSINCVYAASYNTSSDTSQSACESFSDRSYKTITVAEGSYNYKYCYRATCSKGTYVRGNMILYSGYGCGNGNSNPYVEIVSDGCSSYTGTCSDTKTHFCTQVKFINCNKTATGGDYVYNVPTTTKLTTKPVVISTNPTTKASVPASSQAPTTTKRTANPNQPTVGKIPVSSKTTKSTTKPIITDKTTTTTEYVPSSNTNIKKIIINNVDIKYNPSKTDYTIKLSTAVTNVKVDVTLEDEKAKYTVSGNENIPVDIESKIIISVMAENGMVKDTVINVKRYVGKSNDCTLANIYMEKTPIEFSKNVFDYELRLPKKINKLDMEILPTDELTSKYEIEGNSNLKNKSKVYINVEAEDGSKCTYTINIKKGSAIWKYIVLIALLVFGLCVSIYFLYKYIKKSKGNYKYE